MQMNIRGLGLLPILLLASLMCWAVTAVPTDPGQSLQSINVPHGNVDHPEPWPPGPLPTVPELHIRYGKALSETFKLRESDGSFETYDEFFAAVLYPFYSTHEAIGPGNVTPEKPNLFVYFDFFNELERNMMDANRESNPDYKLPMQFQHFAKYRLLLENLRETTSLIWVHDLHQQFHKNLATLELLWLYVAVSLYYHSSDTRPIDWKGTPVENSGSRYSKLIRLKKMRSNFDHLLSFEKSLRKLLGEVYRDLLAAQSENGPVATSLLQKVLEHISSDDWKHFAVASGASVSLREKLKTHCQNAKDWIDGVQNMDFPQDIDEWRMRLARPSGVHEDAGPMITTLQKLLGKVINPMVPKRDPDALAKPERDFRKQRAASSGVKPRKLRRLQVYYGDKLRSLFAPTLGKLVVVTAIIFKRLCNSIRSTLSGERFPQDFASAVKAFNDHVEFLESLSPRVKHLLPVRAINYLEVAFGGPEYFNRFDGAGGQTRDPGVIAEAVTETTQASQHIDADIADMDESTVISEGVREDIESSQAGSEHKHRLDYDDDSLQWLKDNFFVLPDEADVPENGRFGLPTGQSFSTPMDHFRYP